MTACPPMTRYFTLWAFKTDKRSLKSENMDAFRGVGLGRQFGGGRQSHMGGLALPIGILIGFDLIEIVVTADAVGRPSLLSSVSKLSVAVVHWSDHLTSWVGQ